MHPYSNQQYIILYQMNAESNMYNPWKSVENFHGFPRRMFLGAELQEMLDVALAVMRGERERPPLRVAYWMVIALYLFAVWVAT